MYHGSTAIYHSITVLVRQNILGNYGTWRGHANVLLISKGLPWFLVISHSIITRHSGTISTGMLFVISIDFCLL